MLLASAALALYECGGANKTPTHVQKPISIPPSARYLGTNELNNNEGDIVLSGKSFYVPAEDASKVVCPTIIGFGGYLVNPSRNIFPLNSGLVIGCLYKDGPEFTDGLPYRVEG